MINAMPRALSELQMNPSRTGRGPNSVPVEPLPACVSPAAMDLPSEVHPGNVAEAAAADRMDTGVEQPLTSAHRGAGRRATVDVRPPSLAAVSTPQRESSSTAPTTVESSLRGRFLSGPFPHHLPAMAKAHPERSTIRRTPIELLDRMLTPGGTRTHGRRIMSPLRILAALVDHCSSWPFSQLRRGLTPRSRRRPNAGSGSLSVPGPRRVTTTAIMNGLTLRGGPACGAGRSWRGRTSAA